MPQTMERIVNRAIDFTGTYGNTRAVPAEVDNLVLARLSADNAGKRLVEFAHWCYQQDENGRWRHLLPNGQIPSGSAVPWGASGKLKMTRTDRDILRRWLCLERSARRFPPWFYHADQRRWYVDLMRYDCLTDALAWLAKHPVQPQDWLRLSR